jgi:hypothetical protein
MKIKELPSQEYLHKCFDYDEETGELTWKVRPLEHFKNTRCFNAWNVKNSNRKAGTVQTRGYVSVKIDGIRYRVHRVVYKYVHGVDPNHIDHINFNTSDNRICNLRSCTHTQNHQHSKTQVNNTTGFKGVNIVKRKGSVKYLSRITINSNRIVLGYFNDAETAYAAYHKAATEHFGEFAHFDEEI